VDRARQHPLLAASLLALAVALGGCGDDDEETAETVATAPTTTPTETTATEETDRATAPAEPETETESETETGADTAPGATSPEDQPGGAGDEEPARTLALFTGEDGRITPRVVRVPAFISIRVELRSADGRAYGLLFQNETSTVRIRLSGQLGSASSTIDGLRPGQAITGKPLGSGNEVRIEATAEPGP
jgi:hypothetical protein